MTEARTIITTTLHWEGVELCISYEPDWLNLGQNHPGTEHAHLEVQSLQPERAPLPITETGYRSAFLPNEDIDLAGGPIAYVQAWLDQAAKSREWRDQVDAARQLSLF